MGVICIDASGITDNDPIIEGNLYDVYQSPVFPESFKITGMEYHSITGIRQHYKKWHFIPTSNIDGVAILELESPLIGEQ